MKMSQVSDNGSIAQVSFTLLSDQCLIPADTIQD